MRTYYVLLLLTMSLAMQAQSAPDITRRITNSGNVTISAPDELTARDNDKLTAKPEAKTEKRRGDDASDEKATVGDDDRQERATVERPRQHRTTQQTIQGRSVGYRIQAYSDNDYRTAQAKAQQRAREIAMRFPQYRSYITYNAPSWRLRLGDFKNQKDAQAALQRIRAAFPTYGRSMVIVRDRINVWSHD